MILRWPAALRSLALAVGLLPAQQAWAELRDYHGNLGKAEIGLTLVVNHAGPSGPLNDGEIFAARYFYRAHLQDIPLKITHFSGRDLALEEDDAQGKVLAEFMLQFAKQDPNKHFSSRDDLWNEVLIGQWQPQTGSAQDIYLVSDQSVSGDVDGGRCDLDAKAYGKLQDRVAMFWDAAMKRNDALLWKEFKTRIPKTKSWRAELAKSVPHNLFCNDQGFMLGSGIVWFNPEGHIIRLNR